MRMLALALLFTATLAPAQSPSARARELGISPMIGGVPGPLDAITDVAGVEVGHTTLISGTGKLVVGKGMVPTSYDEFGRLAKHLRFVERSSRRQGSSAHRRDGRASAREKQRRPRVRRLVHAERQW